MAQIKFSPLSKQKVFLESRFREVLFAGGYGSGKTAVLCRKLLQLMNANRGIPGGMLSPDYQMFRRDVYPMLKDMFREAGLIESKHYDFNKQTMEYYFPQTDSRVYIFHGKDHGNSIRGPNLGFLLINEVTLCSKETYQAAISRVRVKDATLPQIAMCGTWEGFQWTYEEFIEKKKPDTHVITASTRENIHLHESYLKLLEDSYDPLMRMQYIDGIPTNMAGNKAAWGFNREKHLKEVEPNWDLPVLLSCDFNVNPMSVTFWNIYQKEPKVILKAFFELCLPNSNTFAAVQAIKDYIPQSVRTIIIYPDPAGSHRDTRSMTTDIQIFRDSGLTDLRYKKRIQSVKSCLNAMNALLSNHVVEIDPKCKNLIKDLEQCVLLDDLTIDKSDPMRSHWLDGFKNMADFEFPIIKPQQIKVGNYA